MTSKKNRNDIACYVKFEKMLLKTFKNDPLILDIQTKCDYVNQII
jgi:hypothetical protein